MKSGEDREPILNNYQAQKEYGREKRVGKLHVSAQESTMSGSAFETQDSKPHVTEVSELSESADLQYFAVAIGRKPGIYTDPREYAEQIKGYNNAKSEKFNTRAQAETYIEEQEESNISSMQLVPVLEAHIEPVEPTVTAL